MPDNMPQILAKVRAASDGQRAGLSTGELLIAALVLNEPDWLADMQYSIADALDRIGPEWAAIIPRIAQALAEEDAYRRARYSYRITPEPGILNRGYVLRLFDGGQQVGEHTFHAERFLDRNGTSDAHARAVHFALTWIDGQVAAPATH